MIYVVSFRLFRIGIRIKFIARYVYTNKEFALVSGGLGSNCNAFGE